MKVVVLDSEGIYTRKKMHTMDSFCEMKEHYKWL